MTTTPTTSRTRERIAVAAAVVAATIAAGSLAAAQPHPPGWDHCAYRDHPIAADLGGILPINFAPPPETQAALRGEVAVGTDCSIYDLPV